jgi:hypothetical protein
VTVLHPVELFAPVAVDPFLAAARLEQRTADGTWAASGQPSSPLPTTDPNGCSSAGGSACWRLNVASCTPASGVASVTCYRSLDAVNRAGSVVYGAVLRTPDRIALQYWYWYWYDFWSGTRPATDYVWQAHEGDWEVVTVVLARSGGPLFAGYSQHSCGKRRPWANVPKWPGTNLDLRRQCYQPVGAAILRHFLSEVLEYTGRGARFGPHLRGVSRAKLVPITPASPQWMSFPGYWGEDNLFHAPDPIGTRFAGPGPEGPRFHEIWRDPIGTVLRWPRG